MEALYSVMQGLESRLGGGEGVEGIYGSITASGMHKVLECLRHNCGLGRNSTLIDVGAGLGRPLLHALLLHGAAHGYGVELDQIKVAKANAFCKGVLDELTVRGIIRGNSSSCSSSSSKQLQPDKQDQQCRSQRLQQQQLQQQVQGGQSNQQPADAGTASYDASQASTASNSEAGNQDQEAAVTAGYTPDITCHNTDSNGPVKAKHHSRQSNKPHTADTANTCDDHNQGDTTSSSNAGQDSASRMGNAAAGPAAATKVKGRTNVLQPPQSTPVITCAPIEQIASLEPGSHAYSFWEGVPLSGKQAFGRLFKHAATLKAVAVVQRAIRGQTPEAYMAELGFGPLLLIKAFPVSMSGSGRSFQAYVFSKLAAPSAQLLMQCATPKTASKIKAQGEGSPAAAQQPTNDAAASCTKKQPTVRRRLEPHAAAAAAIDQAKPSQLIHLLTEASSQQIQALLSPSKRSNTGAAGSVSTGAAAACVGADANGSPPKKQRSGGQHQLHAEHAAAAAANTRYSLRPRQLSWNSSGSSGLSSTTRSTGSTAPSTANSAGISSNNRMGRVTSAVSSMSVSMAARSSSRSTGTSVAAITAAGHGKPAARSDCSYKAGYKASTAAGEAASDTVDADSAVMVDASNADQQGRIDKRRGSRATTSLQQLKLIGSQ